MAQVTEAIFTGRVLKPLTKLSLAESQHVRLLIESVSPLPSIEPTRSRSLRTEFRG